MRFLIIFITLLFLSTTNVHHISANTLYKINVTGAIGPAYADYIKTSIEDAVENNATAFILEMDTPGGLDQSM